MAGPVFSPNPRETIAPTDTIDALGTGLVALIDEMPREVIKGHLDAMDINATVFTAQGLPVHSENGGALGRELNPVERKLCHTIQWCVAKGFVRRPLEAVSGLAIIRSMVADGEVFVGQELPYDHYDHPQ